MSQTNESEMTREDYWKMAREYAKEHKCSMVIACLEIKHRYPESREFFGAPPKEKAPRE